MIFLREDKLETPMCWGYIMPSVVNRHGNLKPRLCIVCPECHNIFQLLNKIDKDGSTIGSSRCPYSKCSFHPSRIKLQDFYPINGN